MRDALKWAVSVHVVGVSCPSATLQRAQLLPHALLPHTLAETCRNPPNTQQSTSCHTRCLNTPLQPDGRVAVCGTSPASSTPLGFGALLCTSIHEPTTQQYCQRIEGQMGEEKGLAAWQFRSQAHSSCSWMESHDRPLDILTVTCISRQRWYWIVHGFLLHIILTTKYARNLTEWWGLISHNKYETWYLILIKFGAYSCFVWGFWPLDAKQLSSIPINTPWL